MTDKIYDKHNTMPFPDPETRGQAVWNAISCMRMADEYAHDSGRFVMAEKIVAMAEGWAAIAAVLPDVVNALAQEVITDGGVPENWDGSMYPVAFDVTENERQQILDQRSGVDVILSAERERARREAAGPVPWERAHAIMVDEHDGPDTYPTVSPTQQLRDTLAIRGIRRPGVVLKSLVDLGLIVAHKDQAPHGMPQNLPRQWDTQPVPKDATIGMVVTPEEQETIWALRSGRAGVLMKRSARTTSENLSVPPGVPEPGVYDVMPGAVVSAATVQLMRAAIGHMLDNFVDDGETVLSARQVQRNVHATFNLSLEQDGRLTVFDTRTADPDAG